MVTKKTTDTRTKAQSPRLDSRHTPGPWKVMSDPGYPEGLHPLHHHRFVTTEAMGVEGEDFDGEGSIICALRDQERQAADARLIAAAPELLEALHDCLTEHGATAERSHDYAMRRLGAINLIALGAIQKAEGSAQ